MVVCGLDQYRSNRTEIEIRPPLSREDNNASHEVRSDAHKYERGKFPVTASSHINMKGIWNLNSLMTEYGDELL